MKTNTKSAAVALDAAPANTNADLFAMFQQFMAMQGQPAHVTKAHDIASRIANDTIVKEQGKGKKAKQAAKAETGKVMIHALANSFFVYGEGAPAKLAEFLAKKPHLDRGFKERKIEGLGTVKAYWFGGRQRAKIEKILAK